MARLLVGLTVVTCLAGAAAAQEKKPDAGAAKKPVAAAAKPPADEGAKRDLAMVQGTWEHEVRDRQGKVLGRIVKHIQGNKEMVIHERADGKVTHAHRVEFQVLRANGVRVFRFFNGEVMEGPNKGQKMGDPASYVYRVTEDAFTEISGFIVGQEEQPITARLYKRLKEGTETKDESGTPKGEGKEEGGE